MLWNHNRRAALALCNLVLDQLGEKCGDEVTQKRQSSKMQCHEMLTHTPWNRFCLTLWLRHILGGLSVGLVLYLLTFCHSFILLSFWVNRHLCHLFSLQLPSKSCLSGAKTSRPWAHPLVLQHYSVFPEELWALICIPRQIKPEMRKTHHWRSPLVCARHCQHVQCHAISPVYNLVYERWSRGKSPRTARVCWKKKTF